MNFLYLDFEYISEINHTYQHLICCSVLFKGEGSTFDLRYSSEDFECFIKNIDLETTIFCAYAITHAEVTAMCQIFDREFMLKTKWICIWTEFKMLALTHSDFFTSSTGLLSAIKTLGLEQSYNVQKNDTRDLILFSETERSKSEKDRKLRIETDEFSYTDKEFITIKEYCEADVIILDKLLYKIHEAFSLSNVNVTLDEMVYRGYHCLCAGISFYYHKGYPVDVEKVHAVFENIPAIKLHIQKLCNEQTGFEIYEAKYKGPVNSKEFSHYQFSMKNLTSYLESKELLSVWDRTDSGMLKLENDYLDKMLSSYKTIITPIYNSRTTIRQLNSTDLRKLITNEGFIKSTSWTFNQKTSRSSPKPKLGFLLNLCPWLRQLIHPKEGRALVSIDFKSQEVLIAALLSKDESMLEDYMTDIYIGQAIKTGFAPEGATKKSHPELRNAFKPIVLGTNFGMQAKSLSIHFFAMYEKLGDPVSMKMALVKAKRFLEAHTRAYRVYHKWLRQLLKESRINKHFKTLDNYYYFVDKTARDTQLQNVPCQSNGAAMMRMAFNACVKRGIDVISLHDALIFECAEEDALKNAKIVSELMCRSSAILLGSDYMKTDTKIFTNSSPYSDQRGVEMYNIVMNKLGLEDCSNFKKVPEITDIHLT